MKQCDKQHSNTRVCFIKKNKKKTLIELQSTIIIIMKCNKSYCNIVIELTES